MKIFYDTEHDVYMTEEELRTEYDSLVHCSETDIETFEEYVREVTSKNGTLEEVPCGSESRFQCERKVAFLKAKYEVIESLRNKYIEASESCDSHFNSALARRHCCIRHDIDISKDTDHKSHIALARRACEKMSAVESLLKSLDADDIDIVTETERRVAISKYETLLRIIDALESDRSHYSALQDAAFDRYSNRRSELMEQGEDVFSDDFANDHLATANGYQDKVEAIGSLLDDLSRI